ncbi:MAG TPA: tetratricopeptide repeat protein [Acidobacteriota bacterium]|nr:tetratricopeptide repeat protein [Acidobacteriota bacterium]
MTRHFNKSAWWLLFPLIVLLLLLPVTTAARLGSQADNDTLERAARLYLQQQYEQAIELYRSYLAANPDGPRSAEAAVALGDCLLAAGRFSGAVEAYSRALERFDESAEAVRGFIGLGKAKLALGLVADAEGHFKDALSRSPSAKQRTEIDLLMAQSYYDRADFEQAIQPFLRVTERAPSSVEARAAAVKLADCYYHLEDYAKAKEIILRLLEHDPELMDGEPELAFRWAEILLFNKDYDPAGIVLKDIIEDYPSHRIHAHAILRLGDLEREIGMEATDSGQRESQFRKALAHYRELLLLADLQRAAASDESLRLSDVALLRIIQTADLAGFDLETDLAMPAAVELLEEVIQRGLRLEMQAIARLLLARHYLMAGDGRRALENYRVLVYDFAHLEIGDSARSEYEVVARQLMEKSYEEGDFPSYVDIYLRDGGELSLSQQDKLRLAESFSRVQIYDRAEELYHDLMMQGEVTRIRRFATIGLARVRAAEGDYGSALAALHDFLKLDLSAIEREEALLLVLDVHYRRGDIDELRAYWRERSAELNTPRLMATAMFRLAMVAKRIGESGEALEMFERLLLEFGDGVPGSATIYGYLRDAYLALGDLYYDGGQIRMAAGYYELYIALFGNSENIAFPLFQSANCHARLGEKNLAASIYAELIRLYPDSSWSAQALLNLEELEPSSDNAPGRRR